MGTVDEAALSTQPERRRRSRRPPVLPARSGPARLTMKQTALELFAERGFRNVSVRDITGALDLTSAAIYAHFRSKEDLLHELLVDAHTEIGRLLDRAAEAVTDDPPRELAAHIYLLGIFHTEMIELARIGPDARYLLEPQRTRITERRRAVRDTFEAIVRRGGERGEFHTDNVRLTTALLLNMTQSISTFAPAVRDLSHHALAAHNCRLALRAAAGREVEVPEELLEGLNSAVQAQRDVLDRGPESTRPAPTARH